MITAKPAVWSVLRKCVPVRVRAALGSLAQDKTDVVGQLIVQLVQNARAAALMVHTLLKVNNRKATDFRRLLYGAALYAVMASK